MFIFIYFAAAWCLFLYSTVRLSVIIKMISTKVFYLSFIVLLVGKTSRCRGHFHCSKTTRRFCSVDLARARHGWNYMSLPHNNVLACACFRFCVAPNYVIWMFIRVLFPYLNPVQSYLVYTHSLIIVVYFPNKQELHFDSTLSIQEVSLFVTSNRSDFLVTVKSLPVHRI